MPARPGPNPDGQLSAIIEVMLGTSARIGEALAIRRSDVKIAGPVPTVTLTGAIVWDKDKGYYRQDHPKTARSVRTVALPGFTAAAIRQRLATMEGRTPDALLFTSRNNTPLSMNNVRRQLRAAMTWAGIECVTPHLFRRTVATAVNESADINLAAELLGHTDPRITIKHYVHRDTMVNPATAALLDKAFGT
jgi:integrase